MSEDLAVAEEYLRERLGACRRGHGGLPVLMVDHAIEIVLGGLAHQRLVIEDLRFQRGKVAHWAGADIAELEERYGVPGERGDVG